MVRRSTCFVGSAVAIAVAGSQLVGCTDPLAGRSSSSSAATAAGATTAPPPASPPSQGTGIEAFNGELQVAWDAMRPALIGQFSSMAQAQLGGTQYTGSSVDVEIVNVRLSQATAQVAPGMTRIATSGFELRAPRTGTWDLILDADVRVRLKLGSFSPAIDLPIQIGLEDLSLAVAVDFDTTDPTRPTIQRVGQPQVQFNVRIDSSNSLVQNLTGVLGPAADWIARNFLKVALATVNVNALQGLPGPVPGAPSGPWLDSGAATPFAEVVANVDRKQRRDHLPHGTLLIAQMDTPTTASWLDAYTNGGPGTEGQVTDNPVGGDSAIWTGHYLASQAFRYAVTGDAEALECVQHALGGVGKLLDVNGGTGLLARCAAPLASSVGQGIDRQGAFRSAFLDGETWVGIQGGYGITRDQYSGVMLGLATAYEFVPPVRAEAARRIEMILDYLIARKWVISEDRPVWNGGANGSEGPTTWAGINYQKLAFLHAAHRVNPTKYRTWLAVAGPLAETAWLGMWATTLGFDHYYKYNLGHAGLYTYFRLETDPARWQDMVRAYRIVERYVGHHKNAHFDLIQTTIDPSTRSELFPQTREVLRRFLTRPHRSVAPAVVDLSGVQWVTLSQTGGHGPGGTGLSTQAVQVPSEPLDIHLRKPAHDFIWQRDPFTPAQPNEGNPRVEKPGLDLVMPYWMGRFYGAF